jgi:hypothetical protein
MRELGVGERGFRVQGSRNKGVRIELGLTDRGTERVKSSKEVRGQEIAE